VRRNMSKAVIAIVEDNVEMLEMVDVILADQGYQTILLPGGQNAYQLVRAQQPDLVILDLRMEDPREGWITLDLIRADPATATIPVIMMSGDHAFLRANAERLRSENCRVLPKPFHVEHLVDLVAEALSPPTLPVDDGKEIGADLQAA